MINSTDSEHASSRFNAYAHYGEIDCKHSVAATAAGRYQGSMRTILFEFHSAGLKAELLDTPTADLIWRTLPLHTTALFWGRLVRLDVPLEIYREPDARSVLEPGEVAFLSDRDDIVMGYGRTPISKGEEVRLWGDANVFARIVDDIELLREVRDGSAVSIKRMVKRARA